MDLALQIGDSWLQGDRVLQQLHDFQLLPQILREMAIDRIVDGVATAYGIDLTPDPAEFERLAERVAKLTPFQGMNAEQIATITDRTLRLQQFKQAGWGHKVSGYYKSLGERLERVSYSLMLVADGATAQELFFRVQSAEYTFAELAVSHSQHDTAQRGGTIGPIPVTAVHPALLSVLRQLKAGELSTLFQIDRFYGFLRLHEFVIPQLDENLHQVLLDELFDRWIATQLDLQADEHPALTRDVARAEASTATAIHPSERASARADRLPPIDPFSPDFTAVQTYATAETDEDLPPTTPEVTVVVEPPATDLSVTTGFFSPARA